MTPEFVSVGRARDNGGWRLIAVDGKIVGRVAHRQQFRSLYVYQVELRNGRRATYFTLRDLKARIGELLP